VWRNRANTALQPSALDGSHPASSPTRNQSFTHITQKLTSVKFVSPPPIQRRVRHIYSEHLKLLSHTHVAGNKRFFSPTFRFAFIFPSRHWKSRSGSQSLTFITRNNCQREGQKPAVEKLQTRLPRNSFFFMLFSFSLSGLKDLPVTTVTTVTVQFPSSSHYRHSIYGVHTHTLLSWRILKTLE
jgi:hypothetical protein